MNPCLLNDGSWTDEKHLHFLDLLESSFLHAMFGGDGREEYGRLSGVRLDRELPDSFDSTRDSELHFRKKKTHLSNRGTGMMNKPKKSNRSWSSSSKKPYDPSNDQVVPQLAKGSREDKDHHHHQQTKIDGPN